MKILNLKKENKLNVAVVELIYNNFNCCNISSLQHILNFIVDDLIELIENDNDIDDELIEIYYDEFKNNIKKNLLNRYYLYNMLPIYKNDELINIVDINTYNNKKYDNIQYNSIINLLNNYDELLYEIDEKKFYEILNDNKFDDDDYYELFYKIKKIDNNKYQLYHYEFLFNNHNVFITYEYIDKFELIDLFYKYIDPIVEKIVDEINDDIKYYFKYH